MAPGDRADPDLATVAEGLSSLGLGTKAEKDMESDYHVPPSLETLPEELCLAIIDCLDIE
jgi:hypothetical protein